MSTATAIRVLHLGPADRPALEFFLNVSAVERCIGLGLLFRYGFEGPVSYYGLAPAAPEGLASPGCAPLAGLITVDRGRALLLGEVDAHGAGVGRLLDDAHLRSAFAQTGTMETLLRAGADGGPFSDWVHSPQEVEQQMVLQPADLSPQAARRVPPGLAIGEVLHAGADELAALLGSAASRPGGAGRWAGETPETLLRRLRYGFILAAKEGPNLTGLVWGNMSAPQYPRLSRLWVREERRGEGIATALVGEACLHLRRRGALAVSAWVRQRDQAARRVLGKVGFWPGPLWKKVRPGA